MKGSKLMFRVVSTFAAAILLILCNPGMGHGDLRADLPEWFRNHKVFEFISPIYGQTIFGSRYPMTRLEGEMECKKFGEDANKTHRHVPTIYNAEHFVQDVEQKYGKDAPCLWSRSDEISNKDCPAEAKKGDEMDCELSEKCPTTTPTSIEYYCKSTARCEPCKCVVFDVTKKGKDWDDLSNMYYEQNCNKKCISLCSFPHNKQ